jgi:hypothetical protein
MKESKEIRNGRKIKKQREREPSKERKKNREDRTVSVKPAFSVASVVRVAETPGVMNLTLYCVSQRP